jgi:hypothetical protein
MIKISGTQAILTTMEVTPKQLGDAIFDVIIDRYDSVNENDSPWTWAITQDGLVDGDGKSLNFGSDHADIVTLIEATKVIQGK